MKYRDIFLSLILIVAGILLLAENLDWIDIEWQDILAQWPTLLILIGISFLPIKGAVKVISSLVVIVITALIIIFVEPNKGDGFFNFNGSFKRYNSNTNIFHDDDDEDDYEDYHDEYEADDERTLSNRQSNYAYSDESTFCEDYEKEKEVYLDADFGFGVFNIKESAESQYTLCLDKKNSEYGYSITSKDIGGGKKEIDFSIEDREFKIENIDGDTTDTPMYDCDFLLNQDIIWNMDIGNGLGEVNLDGRNLKIKEITIEQGVSNGKITIGDKYEEVTIYIDAALSTLQINIPKDSYCYVEKYGLINNLGDKFVKIEDNNYAYNKDKRNPSCKINIEMSSAFVPLKIETY